MDETRILIQAALDIQKSKNEIDAQIKSISEQASKLELDVKVDTKSAKEALKQEETMQNKLAKLESDRRKQAETDAKKQAAAINKGLDDEYRNRQKLNSEIEKTQAKIDSLAKDMSKAGADSEMVNSVKALGTELENVKNKSDLSSINQQLNSLSNEFKEAEQAAKQLEFDKNLEVDIKKAQVSLQALGQEWSKIGSNATLSQEFARLSAEAENLSSQSDLTNFNKQVQLFQAEAKEAGVATKSWGAEIKSTVLDLAGLASATAVFMQAWNKIKEIIANVHELDTAMTEFNKVANLSASGTAKFLDEAALMAKEMSASLTDVISAQTEFKKLGLSSADSQELGRLAILYDNVGDSVGGVNQATSSLISTMKAFGIEVADAESIVDKFNEVANETSIDSGEIGSALQRSASALALAGESIDTSIGLIVGGNEIVRDADKVGRHSCPAA